MKQSRPREAIIETGMEQVQASVSNSLSKPKSATIHDDVLNKPKKIFVTDPRDLLPPSLAYEPEHRQHEEISKLVPIESSSSSSDSEPASFSNRAGNSRARGGIEIRHPNVSLENIALLQLASLNIMVKCSRCRSKFSVMDLLVEVLDMSDNKSSTTDISSGERWLACPTCTQIVGIKAFPGKRIVGLDVPPFANSKEKVLKKPFF
jgi:hypothetical protein